MVCSSFEKINRFPSLGFLGVYRLREKYLKELDVDQTTRLPVLNRTPSRDGLVSEQSLHVYFWSCLFEYDDKPTQGRGDRNIPRVVLQR